MTLTSYVVSLLRRLRERNRLCGAKEKAAVGARDDPMGCGDGYRGKSHRQQRNASELQSLEGRARPLAPTKCVGKGGQRGRSQERERKETKGERGSRTEESKRERERRNKEKRRRFDPWARRAQGTERNVQGVRSLGRAAERRRTRLVARAMFLERWLSCRSMLLRSRSELLDASEHDFSLPLRDDPDARGDDDRAGSLSLCAIRDASSPAPCAVADDVISAESAQLSVWSPLRPAVPGPPEFDDPSGRDAPGACLGGREQQHDAGRARGRPPVRPSQQIARE